MGSSLTGTPGRTIPADAGVTNKNLDQSKPSLLSKEQ
jgi:hypothetical protein